MLSTPMTLSHSANDSYRKKIRAIKVADTTVSVTRTVKSLGVTVDSTLSFDQHVNNVCKAANYHIRNLRYIRRCVSVDEAKVLARLGSGIPGDAMQADVSCFWPFAPAIRSDQPATSSTDENELR